MDVKKISILAIGISILAIGIAIILLGYTGCNKINQLKEVQAMYEATQSELVVFRGKDSTQTAKIDLLIANKSKDLLTIKSKDSTINKLQNLVKDYRGRLNTATVANTSTTISGSTVTTITERDTITVNNEVVVFPVYESEWEERWTVGEIRASKDSIHRHILVRNEFEITQGFEKQGLFKPKKPMVTITNLNPYTVTDEIRSFNVDAKDKRIGIGPCVSYGINMTSFQPTIIIGVGAQWSIIRF